jgi:hypothetical protein
VDLCLERSTGAASSGPTLDAVRSAWTALDGNLLVLNEVPDGRAPSYRSLLSEAEVAAFLPSREAFAEAPVGSAPPPCSIPLGRSRSGSVASLPVEPGQGRHFALLGETGMGKSSLLVAVAVRAARLGGLVVLDPLGETAEAIREELGGAGRPLRWVAPGAPGVGANALGGIGSALRSDPVRAERELEDLVHALRRVRAGRYVDASYWGPRLEEMLVRAVRAAASLPGGTLEDAHALLASAGAGRSVVPPAAQAEVRELATRVRDRPDDAEGARRLLYEIVRNPTLAAMLCAREPTLSIPELVAPGRIVLVSGAASRVGESTARYLLAAYLALVWSELLARASTEKVFLLLDEAQWFAHEALGEMLRLARRRNVHVGLATQSLASLPSDVRDAVRTNVADLVVFRGSPEEALDFGRMTTAISAEAVLGLSRGEAAVLLGKGETVRWVRTARVPDGPRAEPPSADRPRPPLPRDPAARQACPQAPSGGGSDSLSPPRGPPPALGDGGLLAEVRARAERLAPGELLRVDLNGLRAGGPSDERMLRTLGSELGRRGAIVRSERTAAGSVWWVDPLALAERLGDRARRGPPAPADVRKRL